jgi:hypothetical protein
MSSVVVVDPQTVVPQAPKAEVVVPPDVVKTNQTGNYAVYMSQKMSGGVYLDVKWLM